MDRNKEPLLLIYSSLYNKGKIEIVNMGWGEVIDPIMTLTQIANKNMDPVPVIQISTFFNEVNVDVSDHLPLDTSETVPVTGIITYSTEEGATREVLFEVDVPLWNIPKPAIAVHPSYYYDLMLTSDESEYTELFPVAHGIRPGDIDLFVIRLAADKSAQYDLEFSFVAVGGDVLQANGVLLEILVPRTHDRTELRDGVSWKD